MASIEETIAAGNHSRRYIMVGLMLAMGLAAMDGTIVATAIPSIVHDLGGFSRFPWVFSVYLLVQAALIPIYGKLADVYGRKPMLMIGSVIFLVGSMLSGMSWNMVSLIIFRGIQGIGAAAIIPIATTVVGDLFTLQERAKMQGYLASVWGISAVIGPAIGGLLVQYASWRWVFYINVPIGIATILVIGYLFHEKIQPRHHTIDYWGSLLLIASMGSVILGLLEGGVSWAWMSWQSLTTLGGGLVLVLGLIVVEMRAPEPVVPLWVIGRRVLAVANLSSLVVGILAMGLSSFLPTYVQGILRQTPLIAGFSLATMSIGWPVASAFSGKLYLQIGFRNTALIGAILVALAGWQFSLLTTHALVILVAVLSLLMGAGLGLLSTSMVVAIQSVVGWNHRGVVTGSNMFSRMLGSTLGVALFGSLVNASVVGRFQHMPQAIRALIPKGLKASSIVSGAPNRAIPARAMHYVEQGLYLGIHRIFIGLMIAGLLVIIIEFFFPRRPVTLEDLP